MISGMEICDIRKINTPKEVIKKFIKTRLGNWVSSKKIARRKTDERMGK